ncbi:MAG TPA: M20 family metallopeptidase [Pyrinomonadaceae bacterium]|nr:M20 family metallopeptidase [Pyrinomonadaceae bacterium]
MTPTETLQYFESRQTAIFDAIRDIVDIESPSHDAQASRSVADLIEQWTTALGDIATFERIAVDDGDHVIIRAFVGDAKPTMFLGHTDTVHPVGTAIQNPTRIEDGKFYGCGIFDMKANIVLMFEALRYFVETGTRPSSPITILLSCDEEIGSHTGREFVEREAANATRCLVFEPSQNGAVKTGRKGTGQYTIRAHGAPAHAGLEPEKGANAIAELARHIDVIHAIQRPEIGTTVNVTTFKGGTTSNVIPEHSSCEVDVRFSSSAEGERVDREIRGVEPVDPRVSLSIEGGINRPPMERTPKVVEMFESARTIAASFGYTLDETQVGGASDGNFVAALGVPVIDGLGIAGNGAHMLTEHVLVDDTAKRATLVTLLLAN